MSPLRSPPTRADPVVDLLHGEEIADPYRWLEDGDSADTQRWTEAQNAFTASHLGRFPGRGALRARLEQLLAIGVLGTPTPVRGRYLYERRDGRQNQPILYVRDGAHGPDRVAVDPNALNPAGTTALDWYHPSEDGRLVAYGLSENGTEESLLHVLDLGTGQVLPDRISRTRAADVAWLPDGSGFYYTRYPAPGTVPDDEVQYHRTVYFHLLGTDPSADPLIFAPEQKEHWPSVDLSPDGRWLLIGVARTFDQTDLYVQDRHTGGPMVPVVRGLDARFDGQIVGDHLYVRTNLGASNYRVYLTSPERPGREHWREVVAPRPDGVLDGVLVVGGHLVLSYLERAASRLRLADREGRPAGEVALPAIGSVYGWGGEWDGGELFFGFMSFTFPPSVYRLDLQTGELSLWRQVECDLDSQAFSITQEVFPSADGTPVTMFLVHRRALERDGDRPTYLTGYGGFNISMTPTFSRSLLLWLESGGILALPNLRGGGEYGEAWHRAGMLRHKQNTFDDFIAAAEWLIRERYTRSARLAAAGGSNGGLLMGAVLTQRPDLFRAMVIQVPLLDMLRYHRFRLARLWIPEYGSPDDPEQFAWLRAYSPYHQVKEGVPYPAVLLMTAESDTRVDPMHARKMTARLQAVTSSEHPILLRLEPRAGHGAGKPLSKILDELTDQWSFVFAELGVTPSPG